MTLKTPVSERLLWLLRHAKADPEPPAGATDHERPLAPRGRRDAEALGRRLGKDGDLFPSFGPELLPEVVLCSTSTRTVQTAERVIARLNPAPDVRYLSTLFNATPEQVLEEVGKLPDDVGSVMVVGHNPTFEILARGLSKGGLARGRDRRSGKRRSEIKTFPTCALAVFRLPAVPWPEAVREPSLLTSIVPPY